MTLPASGAITLRDVNVELGLPAGNAISLNDAAVRTLFGKASGAISLVDGYGKSSLVFAFNNANNFSISNYGDGEYGYSYTHFASDGSIFYETYAAGATSWGASPTSFLAPTGVGAAAGYSIQFVGTLAGAPNAVFGTVYSAGVVSTPWVPLTANASITLGNDTYAAIGSTTLSGTIYIRNNTTLAVISRPYYHNNTN